VAENDDKIGIDARRIETTEATATPTVATAEINGLRRSPTKERSGRVMQVAHRISNELDESR
jgi:hypothetical protein